MQWLNLYLLNNCFGDGAATHLGVRYKSKWYVITHANNNTGVLIDKIYLRMPIKSSKNEYLKLATTVPKVLHKSKFKIHRYLLDNFNLLESNGGKN